MSLAQTDCRHTPRNSSIEPGCPGHAELLNGSVTARNGSARRQSSQLNRLTVNGDAIIDYPQPMYCAW